MKKFLLHMLLCLAVLVLFNFAYIWVVGSHLRDYQSRYFTVPDKVRLLVLGDSHTGRAWATNKDPLCFSFAMGSDNITDMRMKFDYVDAHNHWEGEKVVVLPFEPHVLSIYRETKQNNTDNRTINNPYINEHITYWLPLFFDTQTSMDVKRFILKDVLRQGKKTVRFSKRHARWRADGQFPDSTVSKTLIREYQDLIDHVQKRGYTIIPVRYPLHPYYDSLVRAKPTAAYLTQVIDSLATANRLQVYDMMSAFEDPTLYVDQDHLNEKGAAIFRQRFAERYHY